MEGVGQEVDERGGNWYQLKELISFHENHALYKAVHKETGEALVVKVLLASSASAQQSQKTTSKWDKLELQQRREIYALQTLCLAKAKNTSFVQVYSIETMEKGQRVEIVMEYIPDNLYDLLHKNNAPFPENTCKLLFKQMLHAITIVHAHNICHRGIYLFCFIKIFFLYKIILFFLTTFLLNRFKIGTFFS
ncbi:hypothetical protein QOT17_014670 [Balamuthia mandrillaris]